MNIEDRKELYDVLYDEARRLLKEYDPCKVKDGKCLRGHFCCNNCNYLDKEKGCIADCLLCRLWVCPQVKVDDKYNHKTEIIFRIGKKFDLLLARGTKDDCFNVNVKKIYHLYDFPWSEESLYQKIN
jgi:hypothetical protein